MNILTIKNLVENNTISSLEKMELKILDSIEGKNDISEEGDQLSNILAAKQIIEKAHENGTEVKTEIRLFFKGVRNIIGWI